MAILGLLCTGFTQECRSQTPLSSGDALHLAAKNGDVAEVKRLLKSGAIRSSINDRDDSGRTALFYAAYLAHRDIVRVLLKSGADPNVGSEKNETSLDGCWIFLLGHDPNREDIALMLIKAGATITTDMSDQKGALLIRAIEQRSVRVVEYLISTGADIHEKINVEKGHFGHSPLHMATETLNRESMELLIKNGADVNAADIDGMTPLHHALLRYRRFIVKAHSISRGLTADEQYLYSHFSAEEMLKIVKLLIRHGARCDIEDDLGRTAFDFAVESHDSKIINYLEHKCKSQ